MNSLETLSLRSGRELTGGSIVKALEEFMGATDRMQEVVMIPSRLKDVEGPELETKNSGLSSRSSSSAGLLLSPPASLEPPLSASPTDTTATTPPANPDLFAYYRLLDNLRQELVSGQDAREASDSTDDDISSLDSLDLAEAPTARLAASFRHHLYGLHHVIHQLTSTAHAVSDGYAHQVGAGNQ